MPTSPREIEARYNGHCAVCRGYFTAGTRVSYTPPSDGQRFGRLVHLTCVSRDRSRPEPRFEPFEDRNPLPARLTEYARDQVSRRTVEQTDCVPGRDPKWPCPACDDSGYQCDACGNPGLENAPCNQTQDTAPGRVGRTRQLDTPEVGAAGQSTSQTAPPRLSPGFPRRPSRARHLAAVAVTPSQSMTGHTVYRALGFETNHLWLCDHCNFQTEDIREAGRHIGRDIEQRPVGNPDLPRNRQTGSPLPYVSEVAGCPDCARGSGPSHTGSTRCRSGSLASGGLRAHCNCMVCW